MASYPHSSSLNKTQIKGYSLNSVQLSFLEVGAQNVTSYHI